MTTELTIRTMRLELVAATLTHVLAELSGREALASHLSVELPPSWPPGEYDRDALEFFRGKLEAAVPEEHGWYNWYVMSLSGMERHSLVAGAGYLGPPSSDGVVEIGYSVVPEARGEGYATEIVQALVAHAFESPAVRLVIAHTHESNAASSSVLSRCGFQPVGSATADGNTLYEHPRTAAT